ncbi:MAG: mechanosensitive ion channel [Gammaproteobacteria bacterium]|nr:mechanosensitive ion channel [Gammaproteobacteria bacterium]MBT8056998.1 mechanosensitive ion channel [Gammaproteobacteria bacterium]
MQVKLPEQQDQAAAVDEAAAEGAAQSQPAEELINLNIDLEPILPDLLIPAWAFLQDYPLLLVVLMFGVGYVVGKVIQWILHTTLKHAAQRTKSTLDDKLIDYLTAPVMQTIVILALVAAEKSFDFGESVDRFLIRTLFTLLLFLWGRAWFRAITLAINSLAKEDDGKLQLFQPRTRPLFEIGVKLFLFGILMWLFMLLWNIDGTAWLASAGVIGIAVGFAAQDTLANLISGVSIIADAPYKIGDYIILDTGERGVVTEVGMRSTRLLTRDDVEISIPNAVMGNAKITNESGGPAVEHRIRVPVGVAYGTLPEKVIEVLEGVARDSDMILSLPAPRARMRGFGASSVDFELLGWIRYPEQRGLATHQVLMEIDRRFREEEITIPFPQQDVYIRSLPGGEELPPPEEA